MDLYIPNWRMRAVNGHHMLKNCYNYIQNYEWYSNNYTCGIVVFGRNYLAYHEFAEGAIAELEAEFPSIIADSYYELATGENALSFRKNPFKYEKLHLKYAEKIRVNNKVRVEDQNMIMHHIKEQMGFYCASAQEEEE
ncbi:hypothetical protein A4A49_65148, partial [Nicotiana attenuata]